MTRNAPACSNDELAAEYRRALRYAGTMGHEFVVLGYYPDDDAWQLVAECITLESAQKTTTEYTRLCVVFQRVGAEWQQVSK